MQRHELEAWIGDDHGLTDDQITDLLAAADDIEQRYLDPDDREEREAALATAYRLMFDDIPDMIGELRVQLENARLEQARALASIRQAALTLVQPGGRGVNSQQGFSQCTGVDRMAVRGWLGLRG